MENNHFHQKKVEKNSGHLVTKALGALFCVVGLGLVGYFLYNEYVTPPAPPALPPPPATSSRVEPAPEPEPEPQLDSDQLYPAGKLIVTEDRKAYVDGDIQLYIPRLNLLGPVYNGVDDATLAKGIGLFDQSQLPGLDGRNGNVSLAGHRDVHNKEFYYIDTITDGDRIYLTYQGNLYTYEYQETFVTDPYNWNPIRVPEEACITLQSCTPINVASDRIFVIAKLLEITPDGSLPLDNDPPNTAPPPPAPKDRDFPVV